MADIEVKLSSEPIWSSCDNSFLSMSPGSAVTGSFVDVRVRVRETVDGQETEYFFTITVYPPGTNLPPYFESLLVDQTAIQGITKSYTLPATKDPENVACTISFFSAPSFVTLSTDSTVRIFADATASLGIHKVTLIIKDGTNSPQFSFNVNLIVN